MRTLVAIVVVIAVPWAVVSAQSASTAPATYRMIVHPKNPATNVERSFLADAFLKKTTRWPNGQVILPVDLSGDPPIRRRFSEDILNRSISAVRSYWQQQIFSGRDVPPPELDSEAAVVQYVLAHPGGVGYVSPGIELGGAKVLTVR